MEEATGNAAAATETVASAARNFAEQIGKRKRKRKRFQPPTKNIKEVESQRMTHIAVERSRRKLMNEHLSSLRNIIPPYFIQMGDQASIIAGTIEYVKQLEQLLQSLLSERGERDRRHTYFSSTSPLTSIYPFREFFPSPKYTIHTSRSPTTTEVDVAATVVQSHVNLTVLSRQKPGQLLRAVSELENLHLSVLHLNVTSFDSSVLFSLNLKIEEECKLGSTDEITAVAHQIFSLCD
ncbi:unnamed protein product [Spirodela intermedia]|uniref:BHLH domain-containing protein n=1 Tax=Spirodela intermedia TaxID=51605 RepID=A0A7I8K3A6_SPIIN|nr:unnamed protein product [Spirodela intermedia]